MTQTTSSYTDTLHAQLVPRRLSLAYLCLLSNAYMFPCSSFTAPSNSPTVSPPLPSKALTLFSLKEFSLFILNVEEKCLALQSQSLPEQSKSIAKTEQET
ncbi:hypothetical protein VNO78_34314 [Psophocarpus tetragonolobus]|uniref:Uncharacterized protein n=1 Tax=Psophocarpus tetragonolobus TaxID=3891 RepID=A0AAN9P0C2_PSOTE